MSQAVAAQSSAESLTGLLLPLADRTLLLPNVALAELVPYRAPQTVEGMPAWLLGQISWRELRLPLLSFEAASNGVANIGPGCRVAVLNALGGRPQVKFIALLLQSIPHSVKVDSHLAKADVELAPLELEAAMLDETVVKIPDLVGLEQLLADAGLI
jgi:chemosensory pili system protein ChpC